MIKPILFNTQMVQAILEGRKCCTRRTIKRKYSNTHLEIFTNKYGTRLIELQNNVEGETFGTNEDGTHYQKLLGMREVEYDHKPYKKGDILYVRETWSNLINSNGSHQRYVYRANDNYPFGESGYIVNFKWKPSIHMPKSAARIWLKVTDVRIEKLQDIDDYGAKSEGANCKDGKNVGFEEKMKCSAIDRFKDIWNSTIKKTDIDTYGWDANPWVWVIEFERCENPESEVAGNE